MSYTHYDRLSALDAAFLGIEDESAHMHIGSVGIFEAGALQRPDGGIDIAAVREAAGAALRRNPRFRQKLARVPLLRRPIWVDDEKFNLDYHVRHTCLPAPGDIRQLKRLAGRILSQQLDRGKPLWEMWFVEGLEGPRFAVISKIHHCIADGISGVELLGAFMGRDPEHRPHAASRWIPRAAPGGARLFADELSRRLREPFSLLSAGARSAAGADFSLATTGAALRGLRSTLGAALRPASETPFNVPLGPHRRFDWSRFDLDAVMEVKRRSRGKLNDVVLAVVAGAVRRFLTRRGLGVDELDFRVAVPVSVRARSERSRLGNRVSQMLARLPIDEPDPRRRLSRVIETTRALKTSHQREAGELLAELAEVTGTALLVSLARAGLHRRAANLVVTNVPGPSEAVYLLGSRLVEIYPVVPLGPQQAVGVALLSYAGGLHWGVHGDWDALPDLHEFVRSLEVEFEALSKGARRGSLRSVSGPEARRTRGAAAAGSGPKA